MVPLKGWPPKWGPPRERRAGRAPRRPGESGSDPRPTLGVPRGEPSEKAQRDAEGQRWGWGGAIQAGLAIRVME